MTQVAVEVDTLVGVDLEEGVRAEKVAGASPDWVRFARGRVRDIAVAGVPYGTGMERPAGPVCRCTLSTVDAVERRSNWCMGAYLRRQMLEHRVPKRFDVRSWYEAAEHRQE